MKLSTCFKITPYLLLLFTAACIHPISQETREQVNPEITLEMIKDAPSAYLNQKVLLGGAIIAHQEVETGSLLEVMQWQLNSLGEPSCLEDEARRFLVKSEEGLDPKVYEPGLLITLAGTVLGTEKRLLEEEEYSYPLIGLLEIHLWESPYRYGIYRNIDPDYPNPEQNNPTLQRNPYDPGYINYPYTQFWYRDTAR